MEEEHQGSPFQTNLTNKYLEATFPPESSPHHDSSKQPLLLSVEHTEDLEEHMHSARSRVIGMSPQEKRQAQKGMQRLNRIVSDSCNRISSRAHHTPVPHADPAYGGNHVAIDQKIKESFESVPASVE